MPNYTELKHPSYELNRKFVIERLLALKDALKASIPKKMVDDNFLLATWNIREFERGSYGRRLDETYLYIAEIISAFDLVAIQEVREDITALKKLMRVLGSHWKYLVSDITEGRPGNGERMAFVYDSRKVHFTNVAGEIVLPPVQLPKKNKKEATKYEPVAQFYRTPYLVSFASGWFKFNLCTVHILFGDVKDTSNRVEEINKIAMFFKNRIKKELKLLNDEDYWDRINYILLGDFNIISTEDATYKALTQTTGFIVPEAITKHVLEGTNVARDKFYDQIVLNEKEGNACVLKAGVFDFFNVVYRENDFGTYETAMTEAKKLGTSKNKTPDQRYYKAWRTYQMSDHLPMWVEFDINFSKRYLEAKL